MYIKFKAVHAPQNWNIPGQNISPIKSSLYLTCLIQCVYHDPKEKQPDHKPGELRFDIVKQWFSVLRKVFSSPGAPMCKSSLYKYDLILNVIFHDWSTVVFCSFHKVPPKFQASSLLRNWQKVYLKWLYLIKVEIQTRSRRSFSMGSSFGPLGKIQNKDIKCKASKKWITRMASLWAGQKGRNWDLILFRPTIRKQAETLTSLIISDWQRSENS